MIILYLFEEYLSADDNIVLTDNPVLNKIKKWEIEDFLSDNGNSDSANSTSKKVAHFKKV